MSSNGRTPLLHAEENSFDREEDNADNFQVKHVSNSSLNRSFSAESGQFGDGAIISYHDLCYSVRTKVRGVKTEKQIIKNLRCNLGVLITSLYNTVDYRYDK